MVAALPVLDEISADGLRLRVAFARPPGVGKVPALLMLPGFPRGTGGAATAGHTFPQLADRIARDSGWAALALHFRGTSSSEGDFSMEGWLSDVRAALDVLSARDDVSGVWIAGFRLGGTIAIVTAAGDPRVRGLATFAAIPTLKRWIRDPHDFAAYARRVGVLRSAAAPPDVGVWARAISSVDALAVAPKIPPRPWLAVHGSEDELVSIDDARALAARGGAGTELRIVPHAVHNLRHDPRVVALLLGWLERQET